MALTKGKHIVEEIEGVRCSIVEKGASEGRLKFLNELLTLNKFDVMTLRESSLPNESDTGETAAPTFTIGVTDLLFNPVYAVYERTLHTPEGQHVTPAYWNQLTTTIDPRYWRLRIKK